MVPRRRDLRGPDGLRARDNGPWAKEKLSFLDQYVPPALTATEAKLQRFYVDLFSGPGYNVDGETGEGFEGAALRALPMRGVKSGHHFTHAYLVNLEKEDHDALEARVERLNEAGTLPMPRSHVQHIHWDANRAIYRILREIHLQAYVFVFADIEAPKQWPWDSVAALRSMGHQSIDLYMLFPLDMAINRMISYVEDATAVNADALTRFFGCDDWRPIARQRITAVQSPELRRQLLQLYMNRLKHHWKFVEVVRDVRRVGQAGLYKMLYATNHPAGKNIASWSAAKHDRDHGQLGLF